MDGGNDTEIEPGDRSEYEIIRLHSGMSTLYTVERKIRWCGYLLLLLSLFAPILVLLPEGVRSTYVGDDVLYSDLSISLLAAFSGLTVATAAVCLLWVHARGTRADGVTEDEAWSLLTVEEISSGFAFITGLLGIVVSLVAVSVGFNGAGFVESLSEAGVQPYFEAGLSVPPVYISVAGFIAGVVVTAVGVYASRRADGDGSGVV